MSDTIKTSHRFTLDRTSDAHVELHMDEEHLASLKRMVDYATESFRLGQRYTQGVSKVHIAIKCTDMSARAGKGKRSVSRKRVLPRSRTRSSGAR